MIVDANLKIISNTNIATYQKFLFFFLTILAIYKKDIRTFVKILIFSNKQRKQFFVSYRMSSILVGRCIMSSIKIEFFVKVITTILLVAVMVYSIQDNQLRIIIACAGVANLIWITVDFVIYMRKNRNKKL